MKVLTKELCERIPKLYETEENQEPTVWARLFHPLTNWSWYVIEYDGEDICFGLVDGYVKELGYFSLKELNAPVHGYRIERDSSFQPCKLSELYA